MHAKACEDAGAKVIFIKKPSELLQVDGLILPGGESTVMLKHFEIEPLWWEALQEFHRAGKPMFGTCAGLILLAKTVHPTQSSLGFLDVEVERNAYGRQIDSHNIHVTMNLAGLKTEIDLPFIRAPKIISIGKAVEAIGWVGDQVVMVRQGNILGAACHPEAVSSCVHQYFMEQL